MNKISRRRAELIGDSFGSDIIFLAFLSAISTIVSLTWRRIWLEGGNLGLIPALE